MNSRVKCARCGKWYLRASEKANEARRNGWKQYCSRKCLSQARRRGQKLYYSNPTCNNLFYRPAKEIQKTQNSFCSRSCAASINNQKFPKRNAVLKQCGAPGCSNRIRRNATYCSKTCYATARNNHTTAELVRALQVISMELGRAVTKREFGPKAYACIRAFGSWNESLRAAELVPHRSHDQRMFKRMHTIARDGHRCDSISEAIVDDWLTKNNIPHIRNVPYPKTAQTADWGIPCGVFVEYFGLANDSPRYDRSIRKKRLLCNAFGITLIEIFAEDLYPVIKLDEKLGMFKKRSRNTLLL